MAFDSSVKFNAGAPIDVNKLNKLQDNISSIYEQNSISLNTISNNVDNIQTSIQVVPIIDVGTVNLTVNGNSKSVTFANKNFTQAPHIVASISSNIRQRTSYSVRATATSATGANIEVVSTTDNTGQSVDVQYIAIELKPR